MMQHCSPTIGSLALRALRAFPGRTAISWDGGQLTYAGALDLIGRYQHVYYRRGLRRGQHLALLSANRAEAWCASIAAQASGLAVTWLHPMGSASDHLAQVTDAEAGALIVDERSHPDRGAELAAALAGTAAVFSTGPSEFGADLCALAQVAGPSAAHDLAQPDDVALISYTGGTSGRPKGVLRRHAPASVMFAAAVLAGFEIPREPRYLSVAPMSHVGGTNFLPVLIRGGSIHAVARFAPDELIDTIEREHISMTLVVPTMVYAMLGSARLDAADLSSLRLVLYGAAPMSPPRLTEALERIGPVFSQLYGQTECYPIAALHRAEHTPGLVTSCGRPVPSAQVRLLDAEGSDVPAGDAGEICVRSPAAMDEYWKQPGLTGETLQDGWLHTGDMAREDERGYLFIAGRRNETIISGGYNVYPREVEDALTSHHAVSAAAVLGIPDEHWGETVAAAVIPRPGATVDIAALTEHVRQLKGPVQAPRQITIVTELPKTAMGKIDKLALRDQFAR